MTTYQPILTEDKPKPYPLWEKILNFHWLAFLLMAGLCTAGYFFIDSATYTSELAGAANQQLLWISVGMAAFLLLSLIDYRRFIEHGFFLLAIAILLLIVTLLVAEEINGAKSWIRIGPFNFQAAELSKLAYICALTHLLCRLHNKIKKFWPLLIVALLFFIPVGLILLQPDFGSAAVFAPISFFMLWAAGIRKRYMAIPVLIVAVIACGCYYWVYKANQDIPGLKPYQNNRIRTFFDPELDPLGSGWNIRQSLIAVGSGGINGKGYKQGDQNIYGFLSKRITYNDFIFSVVAEEFGFIGGALLIVAQGLLLLCIVHIATRAGDLAGALIGAGVIGMMLTHFFINVGMTIKVVPITGIPLPFVSYGGTFMVVCMSAMGLMQSVWIHRRMRTPTGND